MLKILRAPIFCEVSVPLIIAYIDESQETVYILFSVFTRSRGTVVNCDIQCNPDESTSTDENNAENNYSDSDRSLVKILTYSSSDSNYDNKSNMVKSSKVNFDFI